MEVINTQLPFLGVASSLIGGRAENQDSYMAAETPDGYLAVVCDGMGGGPGGKTASSIAAATIVDFILYRRDKCEGTTPAKDHSELLRMAVQAANTALRDKIRETPELNGMGTTATVVLASPQCVTMAHVGDSRIYQLRHHKIAFRTTDHSKVGEMVVMGTLTEEQARLSAFSNIITRALGIADTVEVDIDVRPYEKGDRFVLCTDGIWGAMPQPELVKLLTRGPKSLQGTIDTLNVIVEKIGKEKGGRHDNYTILLFETKKDSIMKEPLSNKIRLLIYVLCGVCALSILLNIIFFCLPSKSDLTKELNSTREQLQKQNSTIDSLKNKLTVAPKRIVVNEKKQSYSEPVKEEPKIKKTKKDDNTDDTHDATTGVQQGAKIKAHQEQIEKLTMDLNRLKSEIEALGTMKPNKDNKKNKKRRDLQKSFSNIKEQYSSVLSQNDIELINEINTKLGDAITVRHPEDRGKIKGSKGHCNQINVSVDSLINQIQQIK